MKVIFLNIDGILNDYPTDTIIEGVGGACPINECLIQSRPAHVLNEILDKTGAFVVVIGPKRHFLTLTYFKHVFENAGIPSLRLIGVTPVVGNKEESIKDWRSFVEDPLETFVVLDRSDDELTGLRDHLVLVNGGLESGHVDEIVKHL